MIRPVHKFAMTPDMYFNERHRCNSAEPLSVRELSKKARQLFAVNILTA